LINENIDLSITSSFGVACNRGKNIEWRQLLSQADQALYLAKFQGKNRVRRFSPEVVAITDKEAKI